MVLPNKDDSPTADVCMCSVRYGSIMQAIYSRPWSRLLPTAFWTIQEPPLRSSRAGTRLLAVDASFDAFGTPQIKIWTLPAPASIDEQDPNIAELAAAKRRENNMYTSLSALRRGFFLSHSVAR